MPCTRPLPEAGCRTCSPSTTRMPVVLMESKTRIPRFLMVSKLKVPECLRNTVLAQKWKCGTALGSRIKSSKCYVCIRIHIYTHTCVLFVQGHLYHVVAPSQMRASFGEPVRFCSLRTRIIFGCEFKTCSTACQAARSVGHCPL